MTEDNIDRPNLSDRIIERSIMGIITIVLGFMLMSSIETKSTLAVLTTQVTAIEKGMEAAVDRMEDSNRVVTAHLVDPAPHQARMALFEQRILSLEMEIRKFRERLDDR